MEQFEKVIKALQLTKSNPVEGWDYRGEGFDGAMVHTSTALIDAALALIRQQQERIKELEHEISRLKQHVDCDAAEKIPSGCVGYGRGINDDEPCETCKECPEYNLYGVE